MRKVRFLLDENLSPRLQSALRRSCPGIDVLRVGNSDAPALGTLDPDILRYLEAQQRALVTDNRISMPEHLREHHATGSHHWGIFLTRSSASLGQLLEALTLVWAASEADEWIDRVEWIPY